VGDHADRSGHTGRATGVDADASAHDAADNHAADNHASGVGRDQLDQPDPVIDEQRP